ncbi:arginine/serine-rich splicing factor SC31 transcript V [Panicum miliaceum]|uniref:Arginine/serine-rich splicing factor SC31 transcript V n=1 Tax=Panicum miliaceum TaxID=4540 RepID=A0A3L6RM08_PANMI|nr:arginine/serine-rich splicing factor SC31 transcript V [Panicum miliaceum]
MSHFGRSGPPDIRDTFSLLVLNISFRTTADDLFPLFERYGKVVDVFIPRDRRTGDSRGFAFVRYKYADEAQKAVDRLDGKNVDGRNIMVQFAKYGPNAEPIRKGRVKEVVEKPQDRSRSRSPRPSASPARRSASPRKSSPPRRSPTPERHTNGKVSPPSRSVSPSPKHAGSRSPGSESKYSGASTTKLREVISSACFVLVTTAINVQEN